MHRNDRLSYLIIYVLVLLIALFTPMHSDDFHFYWLGLSLTHHLNQYMLFCGRFFIDYFSSFVLLINNHLIIAMINSLALPLLLYNIMTIPYDEGKPKRTNRWLIAILLLASYWLGNPALGETTFWLVGAANYLWPLVVLSFFLKYLLRSFDLSVISLRSYWVLILLAFFSAVNEINGLITLFILSSMILIAYYKRLPNRRLLIFCLIAALISYIILIAAPGNYVRASSEEFTWWHQMSFTERVSFYLNRVLPNVIKGFSVVFVAIAWGIWQTKGQLKTLDRYLVILFLGCFLIFCLALFVSPGSLTTRSYLTGLFFLLLILSYLLNSIFSEDRVLTRLNKLLLVTYLGWFVISYLLVINAYYILDRQSSYREELIVAQKQQGKKIISIPRPHYPLVLNEGDYPSSFLNPKIADYYGVQKITQYVNDTGFDYGELASLACNQVPSNPYVKCIYIKKLLFQNTTKFIFEFDPQISEYKDHKTMFIMKLSTFNNKGDQDYFISMPLLIRPLGERLFAVNDTLTSLIKTDNKQVHIDVIRVENDQESNVLQIKLSL